MSKNRISEHHVARLLGLARSTPRMVISGSPAATIFVLAGGSEDTHILMRETIIKVNEQLDARGLNLADVSPDELRDMLNDAQP